MNLAQKIKAFVQLGEALCDFSQDHIQALIQKAEVHNRWFSKENIKTALEGIRQHYLNKEKLEAWVAQYSSLQSPRHRFSKVGVVMAGNIPLVGFHDFLSVLMSGHHLMAKLSSQDEVLMQGVAALLLEIEPAFKPQINFIDRLNDAEAYMATGSDNTARYFEFYFGNKPNIIRQNRHSLAIIQGNESPEELENLGDDIFSYFGLGCRNVAKVYLPEGYEPTQLYPHWEYWADRLRAHNKYSNNYDYHRAVLSLNQDPYFDNGFLLLHQHTGLSSPTANLYYEFYQDDIDLKMKLAPLKEKIQVIVSKDGSYPESIPFGKAQSPELWDYADGVDTMRFLLAL